jgi:hypothetical protein
MKAFHLYERLFFDAYFIAPVLPGLNVKNAC